MRRRALVMGAVIGGLVALAAGLYAGTQFGMRLLTWRHLDATYQETFPSPSTSAPHLRDQRLVFHVKTGLAQDDSQICVGFNIIFAALEAGADVTVLFDAGAILDLIGESTNLEETGVPLRLQKVMAQQMHRPLEDMPVNYKRYLDLLHASGARVYANTAMRIVTGNHDAVQAPIHGYPYIEPATYVDVARILAEADAVIVY